MNDINISSNSDEIIDSSPIQQSIHNSNKCNRILTINFCGKTKKSNFVWKKRPDLFPISLGLIDNLTNVTILKHERLF